MSGRKRPERGIFGIPKKKSVLFTFQPRQGEEISSDSEDSDYFPGRKSTDEDDDEAMIKKAKRLSKKKARLDKTKKSVSKKETRRTKRDEKAEVRSESPNRKGMVKLQLPPEILLRIFRYVVISEGIGKFIPRVSLVCKEWHQLTSDPSLFASLDLGVPGAVNLKKQKLDSFLRNDISQCKHLILTGQSLSSAAIGSILALTPRLIDLELNGCLNVSTDLVKQIPEKCPSLQRFDLSQSALSGMKLTYPGIKAFILGCGANLIELRLAGLDAVKQYPSHVMTLIAENCPNLEQLDLSLLVSTSDGQKCEVDLPAFTRGCPKLKELHLDGFALIDNNMTENSCTGLSDLQVYSQTFQTHSPPGTPAFYKMFGSVKKLVELRVSSSNLLLGRITTWVKAVEHLYVSNMSWKENEQTDLIQSLGTWTMSLKTLDLSNNKMCNGVLDDALSQFWPLDGAGTEEYPLQVLNLSNSNVSPITVQQLLKTCKKLNEIDLTSCRELPRGSKRLYKRHEFKSLLNILRGIEEDASSPSSEYTDSE